ncbi:hypothetical protein [Aquabacterium sp.]|uniref:hypothetical protein n=1 Tax=Aquabacterium sp. TaxID=1872578 RepID=UPI0035AFFBC4
MNAVKVSSLSRPSSPALARALAPTDSTPPSLDGVYTRTLAGHQEVLLERTLLDPAERRLLRMVTGLTPLGVLTPQASGIDDPVAAASRLLEVGLIEPVDPAALGCDAA